MEPCRGKNCTSQNGENHSKDCIQEHADTVNGVPSCFDRAESGGLLFDNCRYIHECKNRKTICVDNPITYK